jgi:hypothetical protein
MKLSKKSSHILNLAMAVGMVWALGCPAKGLAQSPANGLSLRGQVTDENEQPIARAQIVVNNPGGPAETVYTDAAGRFDLSGLSPKISLTVSKPGFFLIENRTIDLTAGSSEVSLMLNHETEVQEKLEVKSDPIQIDPDTTSHEESLVQHEILNTPVASSHDLQQSLRTMPQVLADSDGKLHVAGGRLGQTEVLLDGFEVNNPANGGFTSRVNVDSVRQASVETGGYGAEYSHASAGIIVLDTQSGDDRWRFGVTNFIPEASFQQGTHFGNWYPRVTFSGPLSKGKAWFSEAVSIQHTFRLITQLPEDQNIDTEWAGDNLLRAHINLTSRNTLLASFLYNHSNEGHQGLSTLSPIETTLDSRATEYLGSLKDQMWIGEKLLEFGVAYDTSTADGDPQAGNLPYVIMPASASGNYFQSFHQVARRLQALGNITSGSLKWYGTHTISGGWNADGRDFSQQTSRSPITFEQANGIVSEVATFSGPTTLKLANTELGVYAQDLWRPWKPIVLSVGMRTDWDRLIQRNLIEPRFAMNWVPAGDGRMKFTLAWGKHYQPLNLAILSQGVDQQRSDVFYDSTGTVPLGPPVVSSFIVPRTGLAQPRSHNTTAEWDERFSKATFVGASFLLRESHDGFAWELQPNDSLLLQNNRHDRYVAGEVWVRQVIGENSEFDVDYTRSRASSNEVLDPTLAQLILAPQQSGPLLWDTPNRVVTSGWTPLPIWGLFLSGFMEYRTGYPFSVLNEQQQEVGAPNSLRFPDYFSLNVGLEKRFPLKGHVWAIRVMAVNVTGHLNPDTVVNIVGAPDYLTFSGGQARAFTARLRLVTK